jgi:hypothetical protein
MSTVRALTGIKLASNGSRRFSCGDILEYSEIRHFDELAQAPQIG